MSPSTRPGFRCQSRRASRPAAQGTRRAPSHRETRDRLVTKDELLDAVWHDTFVTPNALTRVVAPVAQGDWRRCAGGALHRDGARRGYRFLRRYRSLSRATRRPLSRPSRKRRARTPVRHAPPAWRMAVPLLAGAFLALTGWMWARLPAPTPLTLTESCSSPRLRDTRRTRRSLLTLGASRIQPEKMASTRSTCGRWERANRSR